MRIDNLIEAIGTNNTQTPLIIDDQWNQGKTIFGGLSVALIATAIKKNISLDEFHLYSLTSSFINPLLPNKEFTIETDVIKQGKTVAYLTGKIVQDGRIIVASSACYCASRESSLKRLSESTPNFKAPDQGLTFPYIPDISPKFTQKIEYRLMQGHFPFQGSTQGNVGGYIRFRDTPDSFSEAHLIALIDAWPPSMLPMLKKPAPASTLNWTIQFIQQPLPKNPQAWIAYRGSTNHIQHGIGHSSSEIWDETGVLIALSHQTIAVYG